jgi:hypothetical protein
MTDFAKQSQFSKNKNEYNISYIKDLQKQNILEASKKQTQSKPITIHRLPFTNYYSLAVGARVKSG